MKFTCHCANERDYTAEIEADDPFRAAEGFAEYCFDNWAWESVNEDYPMRVVVDGHGTFEVLMEVVPQFSAYRYVVPPDEPGAGP